MNDTSKEMVKLAFKAMDDKKAGDIKILDISSVSVIADYFIICSAGSFSQLDAITDNVMETLGRAGYECRSSEGKRSGWILLDYGDLVVHIFTKEERSFYSLERIWKDAVTVDPETL